MGDDTIVAVATPPGTGGISIIRLSGPEAERILRAVFFWKRGEDQAPDDIRLKRDSIESHRLCYGHLMDGTETVDECMAVLMRAPRSYTREDVAELHLHGGSYVVSRAMELCLRHGARMAEPGEFTRRAFLNGRIDLSQAEAVMGLIAARGEAEHHFALRQLEGGAATFIRKASDELYALQAGLAACIDYPEEISDEEGAGALRPGIEKLIRSLREAVDERSSRLLSDGLQVALCGRPNVGKSSLLNALLGEDRAIVTEIPGTTRDALQGEMTLNGMRVLLTDTAGLRHTEDPVEKIGVARSEKILREADVRAMVLDGSQALTAEETAWVKELGKEDIIILNKADLPPVVQAEKIQEMAPGVPVLTLSAKNPSSLDPLKELLRRRLMVSDRMILSQPRHVETVRRAIRHLEDALHTLESMTPDVAAVDLQAAQAALAEITGDQADERLLDEVFSRFCVGK